MVDIYGRTVEIILFRQKYAEPISKSAVKNEYISYRTLLLYIKTAAYD